MPSMLASMERLTAPVISRAARAGASDELPVEADRSRLRRSTAVDTASISRIVQRLSM
jgi:hypothetical protein